MSGQKSGLSFSRNKYGHKRISLHFRWPLNLGNLVQFGNQSLHQLSSQFLMGHFPATENDARLGFVPFSQESHDVILFELKIVLFSLRPEFYLLYDNLLLMLLCFVGPFALLVLELTIIHDPANGGTGSRSHFHKIQSARPRMGQSLFRSHDSQLSGFFVYNPDLLGPDHFIHANPYRLGRCDWQPPLTFV